MQMNDLVSRADAIQAARHAWAKGMEPSQYIEIMPAVDAAPVVHGRWIDLTPPEYRDEFHKYNGLVYWMCNLCHSAARFVDQELPYEYCPHCGARMDGGENHA